MPGREERTMGKTLPTNQLTLPLRVPAGRATPPADAGTCIISTEIGAEDKQALLDLFARSSPETRRDRFHHALSVFPQLYLDEIVSGKQLAVAARDICHQESYGYVFALASAAPVAAGIADFPVWVAHAWEGRGVGVLVTRAMLRPRGEQH